MKNYNRIIFVSLLLYLFLAIGAGYQIWKTEDESEQFHWIEINRIYNSLSEENPPDRLSLRSYQSVKAVAFLPLAESSQEKAMAFYQPRNQLGTHVRPWYRNGKLQGYLRFDYQKPDSPLGSVLILIEISLALLEAFLIIVLLYLKYRIIRPFHRVSEMPGELAKGHFKGELKEDKSKYFGQFLWGISQLKDTLDVTKKRELSLVKEKKQMLLSLSHDIKTPLNTIRLYGKALEENVYEDEGEKQHAAHQIGEKTKEIERYVEEIMRSAREDILDITVKQGEFYLSELMDKVLAVYQEKCALRALELNVGAYDNRLLQGDLDRTCEVFDNLFENAFKYGDGRKIELSFYEEDYCQLIRFFNTGEPVTDNDFNHIFESFFRGSNSSGKQGSGLGLYICREILHIMNGEIFAEKEADGMAFVLVLQ